LHVTPAVVTPSFVSFPVMCGERAEDSLSVREEHDTSDTSKTKNDVGGQGTSEGVQTREAVVT
jgi:hypothetical protein